MKVLPNLSFLLRRGLLVRRKCYRNLKKDATQSQYCFMKDIQLSCFLKFFSNWVTDGQNI